MTITTTPGMPVADKACDKHPSFEKDNCPSCGTAREIGKQPTPPAEKTAEKNTTPAKKAAATKPAPAPKAKPTTPFVLDTKTSRKTGTAVSALALTHPEAFIEVPKSKPSHKFGALCLAHNEMLTGPVRREVQKLAADPSQWCSGCGAKKGQTTPVPKAKSALAVKSDFKPRKTK